jgi:dienelactone hydrolase
MLKRLMALGALLVSSACTPVEPMTISEATSWPTLAPLPTASAQPTAQATPTPPGTAVLEPTPTLEPGIIAEHVVAEGETIEQIAERYAVPVEAILQFNDIPTGEAIFVGAILRIPSSGVLAERDPAGPTPFPTLPADLLDNPLWPYTVDNLSRRGYEGGQIETYLVVASLPDYQIRMVEYVTDDGIRVTAQVFVPSTVDPPYPVIILLHGGRTQSAYEPGDGTQQHAIYLARAGYLTIAPDYRSYNDTEGSGSPLKIPWSVDVLNLLEALPTYPEADESRVGVLGHSRGGGVGSYLAVLSPRFPNLKAMSFYNSLSFDQTTNWEQYRYVFGATWPEQDAEVVGYPEDNPQGYDAVSPINYLSRVDVPVHIHHGGADTITPLTWAQDLAQQLDALNKTYAFYCYDGAGHTFVGEDFDLLAERNLALFNYYVRDEQTGNPFTSEPCTP